MVHGEQGAVRRGRGQHLREPDQLVSVELTVVESGHAGVERDDPQTADVVHAVLRAGAVLVVQPGSELRALVVVAHGPHDLGSELGSDGLDDLAQQGVRRGLGLVGQVAGEHQRPWRRVEVCESPEGFAQLVLGVDGAVLLDASREEVRVGDVGDDVPRVRVLAVLDHGQSVATQSAGAIVPVTSPSVMRPPAVPGAE